MAIEENSQDLPAENEGIAIGEPYPEADAPQDFVVVLAYTSTDGEVEEDFGRLVQDIKALYTFKNNVRAYALVDQAATNVLAKVERPQGSEGNKAVLIVSFDQPDDIEDAPEKMKAVADKLRPLFEDQPDVNVRVGIRDVADEVLGAFGGQP